MVSSRLGSRRRRLSSGSGGSRPRSNLDVRHSRGPMLDGDGGLGQVGAVGDLRGPGDLVAVQLLVDVEEDAGLGLGVERLARCACRPEGSGPRDGQVEALGIVLGAVALIC